MNDYLSTAWVLPWHQVAIDADVRFKVLVAHRKARKTLLAIRELDKWAYNVVGTYWYVAPTFAQAKKIVWDDPDMFARNIYPPAWENRNNQDFYITYPNGSKIYMLGGKDPDHLRGPNPIGVVLDEYDSMSPQVWSAVVQPIMTANPDAWCWITGTYKGKRDLYAKHEYAKTHADWFSITVKASESGIIDKDALEEARATTTQAFYDMEYECVPVEGGTSFFNRIRENVWSGNFGNLEGKVFQLGVDLAKYNDWTVLTPCDCTERVKQWGEQDDPFYLGMPERFNRIDWTLQRARIKAAWGLYNKCKVNIDRTGLGDPVVDELKSDKISPLEPITFTAEMRKDLLINFQLKLAQDLVKIPDFEPLIQELEAFSYEVTKSGRVSIEVPDGMHDDCVMSAALALWDAKKQKPMRAMPSMIPSAGEFHDNTKDLWNA